MIPIQTKCFALTDVGAVRNVNEDRYLTSEDTGLWAVADGMGGMARGDWAASQVVECLGETAWHEDLPTMLANAEEALQRANERILVESEARGERMGSTVVMLVVRDREFGVSWVGDSRAYLLRDHRLYRLTTDHSQVQELVDHGLLDPADAATHPLRNVLTRAVGTARPLTVDSLTATLEDDDLLLLCSDGLYGVMGEPEMEALMVSEPIDRAAKLMVERCHALGAPDNITLVSVSTSEVTLAQFGGAGQAF